MALRRTDASEIDLDSLVADHGESIMRVVRRYSVTAADAEDAFQQAIEKLLTRAPKDVLDVPAWLTTVARNEALMIRRSRGRIAAASFDDVSRGVAGADATPEEHALEGERFDHGREALSRLKPDHLRCMLLRADGMSYDEIADATGFSFAKVQRSLWEGRRGFRGQVARIESGEECARIEPLISAYVDGMATDRRDIELHLARCPACRITLRNFRTAPSDLAAIFPVGAVVAEHSTKFRWHASTFENVQAWFNERLVGWSDSAHSAGPPLFKKATLVTAATASLFAGGVGVEHAIHSSVHDRGSEHKSGTSAVPTGTPDQSPENHGSDKPAQPKETETGANARAANATDLVDASQDVKPAPKSVAADPAPADAAATADFVNAGSQDATASEQDSQTDQSALGGGP